MEKFGIFELLDALSAITAQSDPPEGGPKEEPSPPKQPDGAFAPPSYGADAQAPAHRETNALSSFLARHDAVAKKAEKK